jgi:hypothetical protein
MASSTVLVPLERSRYFSDQDGSLATVKREDEVLGLVIDWSDELGADTISSVAYADSGVVTSGKSSTTTTTTCSVSGTGEFEVTVTLASGRKLQRVVRFHAPEGVLLPGDYD